MARITVLLLVVLVSVVAFAQADFTIVALPDTQYYSANFPATFAAQTQWIVDNKATENIQLVIGLGDIVDNGGDLAQWQHANAAISKLDGVVPYVLALGNHDYDQDDQPPLKRLVKNFNSYFGPARYAGMSHYGGNFKGSNENFYAIANLGGKDKLILLLEFNPRDAAINWAKSILAKYPGLDTFIVTHSYGYSSDRISTCDSTASETYGLNEDNDGQELWEKLVSKYANISMVLSGHVVASNGVGRRADYGTNGNLVNQILSDYQNYANGGDGWMRIMRFHPSQNRLDVATYSPTRNQSLQDGANQFSVPLKASVTGSTGTIKGKVTDNAICKELSGATVSDNYGHSAVTDSLGNYTLTGVPVGARNITAKKTGFAAKTKSVLVKPTAPANAKFSLKIQ